LRIHSTLVRTAVLFVVVLTAAACADRQNIPPTVAQLAAAAQAVSVTTAATVTETPPAAQTLVLTRAAPPTLRATVPSTPTATETPLPTATQTPAPAATATLTPSPTPTVDERCLKAVFIADVTILDGTLLDPRAPFAKTWRIRNAGTCAWSEIVGPIAWVFVGGAQMGGPDRVTITERVPPGGDYDVTANLTAPEAAGLYTGWWQAQRLDGQIMSAPCWVQIQVKGKEIAPMPAAERGSMSLTSSGDGPSIAVADWPQKVLDQINKARAQRNLHPLSYSDTLAIAAQQHANDCSQRGWGSHEGSDGSAEMQRAQRAGYAGTRVDESWVVSSTPEHAVAWWLDEAPPDDWHKCMLLSADLVEVGVGLAPASRGYYFIADFGAP
jgi:uncharacterized protein YkwD